MMHGEYQPLIHFAALIPGAKGAAHLSGATMTRWVRFGVPGASGERVRLRAVRLGGRWMTTQAWLDEFVEDLLRTDSGECTRAGGEAPRP